MGTHQLYFRIEIGREITGIDCLALRNEWKCTEDFFGITSEWELGESVQVCPGITLEKGVERYREDSRHNF